MNNHANKPQTAGGELKSAAPGGLIDKRAVAQLLGFSLRHIDNLIAQGLPHLKFGARRTRFIPSEVIAWCKSKFGTQRFGSLSSGNTIEAIN